MIIKESGLVFGNFDETQVYKIENSQIHSAAGENVRSVEFIYLNEESKLLFIEAKSSSPRKETSQERFDEFITEICEKFIHSFDMYCASKLGRYSDLDGKIRIADDKELKYKFILVINGHKNEWLLPLSDELNRKLLYHKRIWNSNVIVINEVTAHEWGLLYQ